jgi:hypothetical protein
MVCFVSQPGCLSFSTFTPEVNVPVDIFYSPFGSNKMLELFPSETP